MRVLLVEDNRRLAELTERELERAGYSVDLAATLADAQDASRAVRYDLVVLDRGLPDGDGLELVRGLRGRRETTPVLVLTAQDAPGRRIEGLDCGADDYLVKPFDMGELAARCRALLRRPGQLLAATLTVGNIQLDTAERQASIAGHAVELRRREIALLEILMRRAGQVVARPAIERSLYAMDEEVTPNALDATVSRLRRRLAEAGATVELRTLHGVGYVLASQPQGTRQ